MVRFEIHGEIIEVANAHAANALRRALVRSEYQGREDGKRDERAECAKLAEAYKEKKMALAEKIERGDEPGDDDDRKEADVAAHAAGVVAFLIRERDKGPNEGSAS